MSTASDYRVDGTPRVRVLCASTGELIYEPTHPWLEQVRCHLLKKWTWINKGETLPTASTMFHLQLEANQQPLDDFQCIGALLQGRPLLIYCSVRAPQRPDTRHRRHMVDAIEQRQGRRLWSLLSNFYPPPSLYDRRGNEVNPLLLALQSAEAREIACSTPAWCTHGLTLKAWLNFCFRPPAKINLFFFYGHAF